jgi:CubicO group peptidase (beta-lactamase class C family)
MSAMTVDGFTAPGFEKVRDTFAALFDEGVELGASFAAVRDGEILVNLWGGWKDRRQTIPWAHDTLVPAFSTSKPIAMIVLALLRDTHGLDFEARVADIWPDFGAAGKAEVTIAQALSHQAGVPGFVQPIDPALWLDPPALAAELAKLAPLWPPGSASGYHPSTWGYIAGELAWRASGRTLGTILREDVCAPRGIDFWIGLPEEHHARCADVARPTRLPDLGEITPIKTAAFLTKWAGPDRTGAEWRRVEIPSANGHGTALAVAQLHSFYAEEGAIGGEHIVTSETFEAVRRKRIEGRDLVLPFRLDWRTGVLGNSNFFYGPHPETLGHSGWGGSCAFGDPSRRLSAAYAMNRQSHHLMGDPRSLRMIDALYACV